MRKSLSILLVIIFCFTVLGGCSGNNANTPVELETTADITEEPSSSPSADTVAVRVAALKGPTAMGMVKLMGDAEVGMIDNNDYTFTIAASADEITPKLIQGELDIAAVPANLASILYNNTKGQVRVLAINTLGVLYIVESGDNVRSVEDLRGKTIFASGKGATPEYALNYILSSNGIDPQADVTIEWKAEHTECLSALVSQENAIAMLPQPFATTAQTTNESIRVALDLTEEWDKIQETEETPSTLVTGVVVARKEFVEEHPEAVSAFLDAYKSSVEYVNGNVSEAAALIGQYNIVSAEVAEKALPYCNITFIEGAEMKNKLSGYLAVLMEQNPQSVGGVPAEDEFYYAR